jgi:exopolysaccharide biosynthesis polyprenyl glycosylphosphotransferase
MANFRYFYVETSVWIKDSQVIYRWMVAVFVLTIVYLAINPNQGFFKRKFWREFWVNIKINVITAALMATVAYLIDDARDYSRFVYLMTMAFSFCWMQLSHMIYRWYVLKYRPYNAMTRKMLIITTSERVKEVVHNIIKEKIWDLWVTGIIVVDKDMVGQQINDIPVVANRSTMFEYAVREVVDEVFILMPEGPDLQIQKLVKKFEEMGITVNLNIRLYELDVNSRVKYLNKIGGYPTITFAQRDMTILMIFVKRMFDVVGGIVGLIFTGIITLILGPMIKLESPGPLFFSQKRVGRNGRIFKIYKFRSMYADAEERKKELMEQNEMDGLMFKMTDDPRITKIGKFIRKTSLDEFPQFLNVLKGDMSLVGTRPPTVDEFEQYEGYHKRRLSMKPGLTGVWQVSGRSDITDFEEIVAMDVDYISNWSLKRDLEIILKTIQVVLHSDGAR